MSSARRYRNTPITEALIELRVRQKSGITVRDLVHCHEGEEKAYPNRRELTIGLGLIEVGPRMSASASAEHVGFISTSPDQKQVYQARLDGFTFSRLAPYESWDAFVAEARRLWNLYRKCLQPEEVTRLAVRYINRLDLPGDRVEIKDYLRTAPEVASGMPLSFDGFFMQLQIPVPDIQCRLLLNETIIEPARPGVVSVVLDIDLFRTDDLPKDEEGLWALFEQMHVRKNEIFETCITDRSRELFY
ncbi:MAG: TIGR04255 family protein [Planctomycetes bacterium]|nr:TIGR04255 family protein [Planctomycetota bacterium]